MWGIVWPVIAFAAGALITAYRGQYTEYASALSDIIKDIEFARDRATQYWVADADPEKDRLAEVEIRSALHQISRQFYGTLSAYQAQQTQAADSLVDLHALCTGGEFETTGRTASKSTASELRIVAAELIIDLRREKIRVSQWKHVFVSMTKDVTRTNLALKARSAFADVKASFTRTDD